MPSPLRALAPLALTIACLTVAAAPAATAATSAATSGGPVIASISPDHGPVTGGGSIEIDGSGFGAGTTVDLQVPTDGGDGFQPVTITPMKAFPILRDLATDVSWNFRVKQKIKPFKPCKPQGEDGTWRMSQEDVERVQEFRKCIECFLCQDVCHVTRDHHKHDEFIGPRFFAYTAALEMHPLDTEDRIPELKQAYGLGFCNITKCCTKVCPEHIAITDNAIIPLKERVVDEFYDPLGWLWKKIRPQG